MVSSTPQLLYPRYTFDSGLVGPRSGLDVVAKKIPCPACPARSCHYTEPMFACLVNINGVLKAGEAFLIVLRHLIKSCYTARFLFRSVLFFLIGTQKFDSAGNDVDFLQKSNLIESHSSRVNAVLIFYIGHTHTHPKQ
jgi:hypothetical protein